MVDLNWRKILLIFAKQNKSKTCSAMSLSFQKDKEWNTEAIVNSESNLITAKLQQRLQINYIKPNSRFGSEFFPKR